MPCQIPDVLQSAARQAWRRQLQGEEPDDVAGEGRRDGVAGDATGDIEDIWRIPSGARGGCAVTQSCLDILTLSCMPTWLAQMLPSDRQHLAPVGVAADCKACVGGCHLGPCSMVGCAMLACALARPSASDSTCRAPGNAAQSSSRAACKLARCLRLLLSLMGWRGRCLWPLPTPSAFVRLRRVLVGLPDACQRHARPGGSGSIVRVGAVCCADWRKSLRSTATSCTYNASCDVGCT